MDYPRNRAERRRKEREMRKKSKTINNTLSFEDIKDDEQAMEELKKLFNLDDDSVIVDFGTNI
ncbi:MAG: hypothetical protein MJH09_05755 [Cetobacterium sp.]|nr:hypothetical protein [Cetobacterium sp.]